MVIDPLASAASTPLKSLWRGLTEAGGVVGDQGQLAVDHPVAGSGADREDDPDRLDGAGEELRGVERACQGGGERVERHQLLVAVAQLLGAFGDATLELVGGRQKGLA